MPSKHRSPSRIKHDNRKRPNRPNKAKRETPDVIALIKGIPFISSKVAQWQTFRDSMLPSRDAMEIIIDGLISVSPGDSVVMRALEGRKSVNRVEMIELFRNVTSKGDDIQEKMIPFYALRWDRLEIIPMERDLSNPTKEQLRDYRRMIIGEPTITSKERDLQHSILKGTPMPKGVKKNVIASRKTELRQAINALMNIRPIGNRSDYKSASQYAVRLLADEMIENNGRVDYKAASEKTGLSRKTLSRIASTIRNASQ